jgi:hypothetical protein
MSTDDELRLRIQEVAGMARANAEHANVQQHNAELLPDADTSDYLLVIVNHRASAIAWTVVATALEELLAG